MVVENEELITNETTIAEIMNSYFTNITRKLNISIPSNLNSFQTVQDIINYYKDHENIKKFLEITNNDASFNFRHVTEYEIRKIINELNPNKGALTNCIPVIILKDTSYLK